MRKAPIFLIICYRMSMYSGRRHNIRARRTIHTLYNYYSGERGMLLEDCEGFFQI